MEKITKISEQGKQTRKNRVHLLFLAWGMSRASAAPRTLWHSAERLSGQRMDTDSLISVNYVLVFRSERRVMVINCSQSGPKLNFSARPRRGNGSHQRFH